MTVSEVNPASSTEKLILRALLISVLLHMLIFSVWRVGQAQGWWRNFAMPRWMQMVTKTLMPVVPKKPLVPADVPSQTQLTFVEIDPALATPEPPKKPMFQGAKNTVAANREIKVPSDMPNIDGRKEEFLKTTEDAKPNKQPMPLPSPSPPAAQPRTTPQTTPQPQTAPQPVSRPTPQQSAPKKTYAPGDLAMATPSVKPREGKGDAEANEQTQPQPQPQPQPENQRPRTIAEAMARSGNYGPRSRQTGGVAEVKPDPSLDVKGTPLGDYIGHMVDSISTRWHELLKDQTPNITGKVQLRFRLHPDGSISDVKVVQNEVSAILETTCEQALLDPSPYGKWTTEMRLALPADFDDITFTFYYETY